MEMRTRAAGQLDERFDDPCTFDAWPPIPIHVSAGRDDRFFPLELQQRVARDRLRADPASCWPVISPRSATPRNCRT
jgi:hypothetical protein